MVDMRSLYCLKRCGIFVMSFIVIKIPGHSNSRRGRHSGTSWRQLAGHGGSTARGSHCRGAHCPQGASYPSPRLSVLFRKTTLCRQKRPLVNEMSEIKHAEQILNHLFICVNESCLPGKIKYFQGFQGPGFMLDYCWLLLVSF